LSIPAVALDAIEGIADALSSFSKLGAGYIADRLGHRKALVVTGYGLTTLMLVFFALATGWVMILVRRIIGWLGRAFVDHCATQLCLRQLWMMCADGLLVFIEPPIQPIPSLLHYWALPCSPGRTISI
jgi:MFS family permease